MIPDTNRNDFYPSSTLPLLAAGRGPETLKITTGAEVDSRGRNHSIFARVSTFGIFAGTSTRLCANRYTSPTSPPKVYPAVRAIIYYMASSTRDSDSDHEGEIRMWCEDDSWVITDVETGVTTQGETREEALEVLDEAVALHKGEIGREPTDEELRELGIDPEDNTTGDTEPPDFMQ